MYVAEIAKRLGEKDPSLLLPENKDKLSNDIRALTPEEVALILMIATHEDVLSQA